MGNLRIKKVIYSGKNYFFESEIFDKNIILIEGDNGTGKSTLCNLIYFGLGGRVNEFRRDNDKRHKEITSDTDNYVELYIQINAKKFLLRRYLSENDITVTPFVEIATELEGKTTVEYSCLETASKTKILPIFRREDMPFTFSDWILGELNISVIELFQGYSTFKINFSDLMRLMYHDQQPDPEFIYKKLDTKPNYVSDSETLRKATFELLVGKTFSDFYDVIIKLKKAEKDKAIAKSLVDEYTHLADKIRGSSEVKNINFLKSDLLENEARLDKLQSARMSFKQHRKSSITLNPRIEALKAEIFAMELKLSDIQSDLITLYGERFNLVAVKNDAVKEISQLQKIIHAHDKLNLFSSDTCPYCLANVNRKEGHCVCGASIKEEQFERFFYTSQEYNEILKAKTKSLSTIELALTDCTDEIESRIKEQSLLKEKLPRLKSELSDLLDSMDQSVDLESINDIDDKILEIREIISKLYQMIEIETKLEALQKNFERLREECSDLELTRKDLETKSKRDITNKVSVFSRIYNDFMVNTLSDCRSARIRLEDYMPSINDGEYREASARVSIRLMYYLSLLKLSLLEKDVAFPRFLLVDTPETAGIELENLINCLSKFEGLEAINSDYQVILATGLKKYPPSLENNRFLYMPTKADALLKLR